MTPKSCGFIYLSLIYVSYANSRKWTALIFISMLFSFDLVKQAEFSIKNIFLLFHRHRVMRKVTHCFLESLQGFTDSSLCTDSINCKSNNPKIPKGKQCPRDLFLLLSGSSQRPNQKLFNNGTFACVNVDVSMMLNDYETFANFECLKKLNVVLFCTENLILNE